MSLPPVILPGATLGVLGGGQLGRMFAMAAQRLGYQVVAFTPENDSPASQVCANTIVAPYENEAALKKFADQVSAITIEFENIPSKALQFLEKMKPVRPGSHVLNTTQNRMREKIFLAQNKFPVVPFHEVTTLKDLDDAIKQLGLPLVLKTAGFGYDGKGQVLIKSQDDAKSALESMNGATAIAEKFIKFQKEISVIGARGISHDFAAFGPIENEHRNHILDLSVVPARVDYPVAEAAIDMTRQVMEALDVVGLLCVEFFLGPDDEVLINELAPRPHNSGHLTIEACQTSQFEQQVRCLTGLPLGNTETEGGAAMAQLLGDLWTPGEPNWVAATALPGVHLHLYGKHEARPGRKMGHLTVCAKWADEAIERVKSAREALLPTKTRANQR